MRKKGQEEMVGFALIIIVVAVILLIFLSFSLRKSGQTQIESYEADSFIQAFLQSTTECAYYKPSYLSIKELIKACDLETTCSNGKESCKVLKETIEEILEQSWNTGEESVYKGNSLEIYSKDKEILKVQQGNETKNYKGSAQILANGLEVKFKLYY